MANRSGKSALVTGGAGFVGCHVVDDLVHQGFRVTIIDSLRRSGVSANIRWLHDQYGDRITLLQTDVRDADAVHQAVARVQPERVYHLAAQVAVTCSILDPREDFEVNALGTLNVLEAVRAARDKHQCDPILFYTSTNKVYGRLDHLPTVEQQHRYAFADSQQGIDESVPLDFYSPYGCSKGTADQYVRDYARIYGLCSVVFRMSCIYGPRQYGTEDQGWLAHFVLQALHGQPVTIYGDGKQVRDILFVDDLVRAFNMAAQCIERTRGQVYNIGGGRANSVSLREVISRIEQLLECPITIEFDSWRPGDQPIYVTDTGRAGRDFAWQPQVSSTIGLSHLLTWARSLVDAPATKIPGGLKSGLAKAGSAKGPNKAEPAPAMKA